jgi:hypothetical protein
MKKDEDQKFELVIIYMLCGCAGIVIAALARLSALKLGLDVFTANLVFIVFVAIAISIFLSIQLTIKNLMFPWIKKLLLKTPHSSNKKEEMPPLVEINTTEPESIASLDYWRNEQLQNKAEEKERKLKVALHYSKKAFISYTSDEHIDILCEDIILYANKLDLNNLKPIIIKSDLSTLDLLHFGWNIWNHFRISNQNNAAYFLKLVFAIPLKDMEVETIKKHLKDDELKGIIKIQENISEY